MLDPASEDLRIARDGATPPPRLIETVVEVGAEPPTFTEQGIVWRRATLSPQSLGYAPDDRAERLLGVAGRGALGL